MKYYQFIKQAVSKVNSSLSQSREMIYGLVLYIACRPEIVNAGLLSKGICKPYKSLVDNELFVVIAAIAAAVLVIVWKMAPSGGILAKGIGLLAALVIGLNIENILQVVAGTGLAC